MEIIFLILYWLFFFRKELINPFRLATAEVLSECFPNIMLAGEYWSKGKLPRDSYFYQDDIMGAAMSSVCYPPNIVLSIVMRKLSLNKAFALQMYVFLSHFLVASVGGYVLFGGGPLGLIGGLLFGYSGYMVKHYPPIVATMAWIPWALAFKGVFLPAICLSMAFLAGYLPIAIYFTYFFVFMNPLGAICGLLIASPFLCIVGRRYSRSVLREATAQSKMRIGCVPKWKMLDFFLPMNFRHYINGVGFWEMSFYMSPVVLFSFWGKGNWWLVVVFASMFLFWRYIFEIWQFFMHRIPARWGHMVTVGLIFTTISGISKFSVPIQWGAIGITALCLLENSNLITYWPFTQPWIKPSEAFKEYTGKWPTAQGQIHHIVTGGYQGCFRKKSS